MKKKNVLLIFFILLFLYVLIKQAGPLDFLWKKSNRELNITMNLPYVQKIGNIWTGMGYVENSAFLPTWSNEHGLISAFGVATSALDMYYVYLYCSTGIFGCLIIGGILLYMLYVIWKQKSSKNWYIYISIYVSILFYAIWESVIFTYRFWQMIVLTVLLLCAVQGISEDSSL